MTRPRPMPHGALLALSILPGSFPDVLLQIFSLLMTVLGTPLFIIISALALLSFSIVGIDKSVVIIAMSRLAETPLLISLPLFIFAGNLLSESGAPRCIL